MLMFLSYHSAALLTRRHVVPVTRFFRADHCAINYLGVGIFLRDGFKSSWTDVSDIHAFGV
jgi:hypothetical protein